MRVIGLPLQVKTCGHLSAPARDERLQAEARRGMDATLWLCYFIVFNHAIFAKSKLVQKGSAWFQDQDVLAMLARTFALPPVADAGWLTQFHANYGAPFGKLGQANTQLRQWALVGLLYNSRLHTCVEVEVVGEPQFCCSFSYAVIDHEN